MELVEQHGGDPGQFRIVENLPGEGAFGDDFDPRRARHFRAEPDPVADGLADAFAQRLCHPLGAGAGGDPPRLQHDDFPVCSPWRVEQRQWHPRGLAGAGRRHQHGGVAARKRDRQPVQHRVDRERRLEAAGQISHQIVMPGLKREARLRADVPGIHVFLNKQKTRRGWP